MKFTLACRLFLPTAFAAAVWSAAPSISPNERSLITRVSLQSSTPSEHRSPGAVSQHKAPPAGSSGQESPKPLQPESAKPSTRARIEGNYGRLPLFFEPNLGQADPEVKFLSRGLGRSLFLTSTEAVLVLTGPTGKAGQADKAANPPAARIANHKQAGASETVLRMKLVDANPDPVLAGSDALPGQSHYFLGSTPSKWTTDVPNYARVRYQEVYPGIDLVFYGNQRELEYDFVVAPGADPNSIKLAFQGAETLDVDVKGNLVVRTASGDLMMHAPRAYQDIDGVEQPVKSGYALDGNRQISFETGEHDVTRTLIIDPALTYATYLGGSGTEIGRGITVDSAGNAYVVGSTQSLNFPTLNPLQPTNGGTPLGGSDVMVAKLNPTGSALVYSTYVGGNDIEDGFGIAVDSFGNVYITGMTASLNFPTLNPIQATRGGVNPGSGCCPPLDAFVAKLDPLGSALVYSTFLGGARDDYGTGMALDLSGNAYITGLASTGFPTTTNAFQPTSGGSSASRDAFVAKVNPSGSALVYSTFLGGIGNDSGEAIAVDGSGNAYVTGGTPGFFPLASPLQPAYGGGAHDAFVARLNSSGSALTYSTYLGGSDDDLGVDLATDASGNAYVVGTTLSSNFPAAANAFGKVLQGPSDAFAAKVNAAGSALIYSTFLGGSSWDRGSGIAVDSLGYAYIAGNTQSTDFPTTRAVQNVFGGGSTDAFVAKFNDTGSSLVYSTYLGGSDYDAVGGIAVDSSNACVVGETASIDFPVVAPFQNANGGAWDAFIARITDASGGADLSISKSHSGNFTVGASGTYTITVQSVGSAATSGPTTVVDNLPGGLSFVSAGGAGWSCSASGQTVSCGNPATMAPGTSSTITLTVAVGSAAAPGVTNTVFLSTASDNNPADDSASDPTTVTSSSLAISMSRSGAFSVGSTGTYAITVSNVGSAATAGTVTVTDTLSTGVTYLSSAGAGWSCSAAGQTISCSSSSSIAAGSSSGFSLTVAVGPTAPARLGNTVKLSSSGAPISLDSASVEVPLVSRTLAEPAGGARAIRISSDVAIIAEKSEYADGAVGGEIVYNAFGSNYPGVQAQSTTWYFPDVYTAGYQAYLVLMNPNPASTSITATYLVQGGSPVVDTFALGAGLPTRISVSSDSRLANKDVAVILSSSLPILAHKSISWAGSMRSDPVDLMGGDGTLGAPKALTQWYLAEGSTAGWKLWYIVMNPSASQSASVTFNYLVEGGAASAETFTLGPQQKRTVYVNDILPFANVSLNATSNIAIVVERMMHWNASVAGEEVSSVGGSDSMGVESPQKLWYLAEGSTAGWHLWVLLMNPNNSAVLATVTWLREGLLPIVETYNLAANSRKTIEANRVPGLEFANVSVKVETTAFPIIVERAMYWDTQLSFGRVTTKDGHSSPGINASSVNWYMAATSTDYRTFVMLMNPQGENANVTLQITSESGQQTTRQYVVPANSRKTLQLNSVW